MAEPTGIVEGVAVDLDRAANRGYPEAVYCEGKSDLQVREIAETLRAVGGPVPVLLLAVWLAVLHEILPDAAVDDVARLVAWPAAGPEPVGGRVVVLCAGTADLPVAREALLTASTWAARPSWSSTSAWPGCIGSWASWRCCGRPRHRRRGGWTAPCRASWPAWCPRRWSRCRPQSGMARRSRGWPLLAMLNACAPGVAVVNIDNGYGAGHWPAQIAAPLTAAFARRDSVRPGLPMCPWRRPTAAL